MSIRIINILEEGRYGGPQARTTLICKKMNDDEFAVSVVFPRHESELLYEKLVIAILSRKSFSSSAEYDRRPPEDSHPRGSDN